jgi:hypothetical protein
MVTPFGLLLSPTETEIGRLRSKVRVKPKIHIDDFLGICRSPENLELVLLNRPEPFPFEQAFDRSL